jgi:hypothetical protein
MDAGPVHAIGHRDGVPVPRIALPGGRRVRSLAAPVAFLLVALTAIGAGPRVFALVALPALVAGAVERRLPRAVAAGVGVLLGVLALGAGSIADRPALVVAGVLWLLAGIGRAWGINRGRPRRRAWINRGLTALGAVAVAFLLVYPTLLTVGYLAKPRRPIDEAALGLPHARVAFPASDGVRLSGWFVPSRNGAAIVLVHGGGGDRQGTIRHARMLAAAGYGVLLYDARGRGTSAGQENAFGWQWHRDVRGAVSFLAGHGVRRIGLLGLSTGAEAVVTEAAHDPRVGAVVADGLQGRTAADAGHLPAGDRISVQPAFVVAGAEIQLATGQHRPPPLKRLVHELARTRPLLLIGTVAFERAFDRAYTTGTGARLWELPDSAHTGGLADRPGEYRARVLSVFDGALLRRTAG